MLHDGRMVHDVAFREREEAGVAPFQVIGAVPFSFARQARLGQEEHGQHVINLAAVAVAREHGDNCREVFDARKVDANPTLAPDQFVFGRAIFGPVVKFKRDPWLRRAFLPLIEVKAAEVGDFSREMLDPAGLDAQFLDRAKARIDGRIRRAPGGLVSPVRVIRRGEDDRREARIT